MARKHNTRHNRGRSNYKKRLEDRGLGRTPRMKWTGMTTQQIIDAMAKEPQYKWVTVMEEGYDGKKHPVQRRKEIIPTKRESVAV